MVERAFRPAFASMTFSVASAAEVMDLSGGSGFLLLPWDAGLKACSTRPDAALKAPLYLVKSAIQPMEVEGLELQRPGSRATIASAWTDSLWLRLSVSLIAGLLWVLILMGAAPLNPRNIGWLGWDGAQGYIAWGLFRQDPHWHWPLTYTNWLGYPAGLAAALLDPNPLFVVLLKPFSPLLPEQFQYFGIEAVLICALQFFFAMKLFRLVLGPNPLGIGLCSLFFLMAPPLAWRLSQHYALGNHWLILAALLIFFQAQQESPRAIPRFVVSGLLLTAVAGGINPYLAIPVGLVLTAAVVSLLWQRRLPLSKAVGFMAAMGLIGFVVPFSLGFVIAGSKGYAAWGYRHFSMNLLSPVDPGEWASVVVPRMPEGTSGQYEGYNYLGAGVLAVGLIVLGAVIMRRSKLRFLDRRWLVPLLLCCMVLTLMALSTRVMIGSKTLVDLDPRERLSPYLSSLRASGRLFWTPYYVILVAVLAAPFAFLRKSWANVLIACALLLQIADTRSLVHWVHTTGMKGHPSPLKSPVWSQLGSLHENLVVLPAWQCAPLVSPDGFRGFQTFGFLSVAQRMHTNSYRPGRYTEKNRDLDCRQAIVALSERPLSPDTAYVVTPKLAAAIAAGPTGPGKCHEVDGFVLCSAKTDFKALDRTE
jgi:Family of unknown function (DUF6311)